MVFRDGCDSVHQPRAGYGGSGRRAQPGAGGASDPKRARQDRLVVAAPHSSGVEAVAPAHPFGRASVPASPDFRRSPKLLALARTLALPGFGVKPKLGKRLANFIAVPGASGLPPRGEQSLI